MKTCLLHTKTFARISERLKEFEHNIEFILMDDEGQFYHSGSRLVVDAPRPDIVFGNADAWFSPHVRTFMISVLKSGKIDWFQSAAAGLDNPALVSVGKISRLYTTNHSQAEAMAEWALWQALDYLKRGPVHRAHQADREWTRLTQGEIMGSRWLVIGFGSIGQAVGWRVQALGGRVTGIRRSPGPAQGADHILPPALILSELPDADIVLLCAPLTEDTAGMANAKFFAAMKAESLFMNLGRGALVRQDDLIAALDMGRPAHAALDVTVEEPLPANSPLWQHPDVTITPHDSSVTDGTNYRADDTFVDNLSRYMNGKPLQNLVDSKAFQDA